MSRTHGYALAGQRCYGFGVYDKRNLRKMVEGMFYRLRTGLPWRDLPEYLGSWNAVYKKFNNGSTKGIWKKALDVLVDDPDLEWGFIDGSYVKAHQHSAGASGGGCQAVGPRRGGNTSKIHVVVDGFGLPVYFEITGGQAHDSSAADSVLDHSPLSGSTIADKGYDKEMLREKIRRKNSVPVIPGKCNSKIGNKDIDGHLYKMRHLVENQFARLKHYRAIATR